MMHSHLLNGLLYTDHGYGPVVSNGDLILILAFIFVCSYVVLGVWSWWLGRSVKAPRKKPPSADRDKTS